VARHSRRRPRPPTRVLIGIGIAAILLALVVALAMIAAPRPDPRPAGMRLTPPSTAPPSNASTKWSTSGESSSPPSVEQTGDRGAGTAPNTPLAHAWHVHPTGRER
jgi:hypothetical protein